MCSLKLTCYIEGILNRSYVGRISNFMYHGSTALLDVTVCGGSGTIAAVTKLHSVCDVSCCLPVDQERLQGSGWM
jgi:hypothetical protein